MEEDYGNGIELGIDLISFKNNSISLAILEFN